ncbi:hypothetical protein ACFRFQ_01280 [Rhodococcus sp. NPDC056743]|uniref:hypothetical protein n=1 Tax=Rhodococcus sp. NPDC056743 TaxID=3345934 RepID=UPI0036702158
MKAKGQVALAVGAGYMLGRTRRMKMALMLAAAGATGRFPGGPRDLLERGTKMLAKSPEAAKIGDVVREELVSAAKAAAVTAASQRIDSLSNRLLAGGHAVSGTVSDVSDSVGDVAGVRRLGRKKSARSRDDERDEEEVGADEEVGDDEAPAKEAAEEESTPRKRAASRRRTTSTARKTKDDMGDEDEEPPERSHRTRAKAATDSAPVRRARR